MEAGCFPAIGNFVGKGKRKMRVGKEEMGVLAMEVAAEMRKKGWRRFAGVMESVWFFCWSSSYRETLRDGDREKGRCFAGSGEKEKRMVMEFQLFAEEGSGCRKMGLVWVIYGENERERMERDVSEIMVRGEGAAGCAMVEGENRGNSGGAAEWCCFSGVVVWSAGEEKREEGEAAALREEGEV
ncbi:hypothetical protein HAX54_034165 [Datura stramonium]|uniref:Uncharacterized protein n=1 Tax=Datura stramonium TaxID=4076 RepID=A0ABS8RLT2_DATST|nr:hypothetical protein [Datura stramonium]